MGDGSKLVQLVRRLNNFYLSAECGTGAAALPFFCQGRQVREISTVQFYIALCYIALCVLNDTVKSRWGWCCLTWRPSCLTTPMCSR